MRGIGAPIALRLHGLMISHCARNFFGADVHQEVTMLRLAVGFFIVALIAAVLGFGGLAATAAGIAKLIFYIFLVLFVVSLLAHLTRGTRI